MLPGGFSAAVETLSVGKKLPDAVYVHRDSLEGLPEVLVSAVEVAQAAAHCVRTDFDVVRFERRKHRLSLLSYPRFFEDAFPELAASWNVDLDSGSVRETRYAQRANAPILHRKETLLSQAHPRHAEFAGLTEQAERLGLLEDAHRIGTRAASSGRLERLGYRIDGNRFVRVGRSPPADEASPEDAVVVQRHRTALQRYSLSSPMQALYRHGYLNGDYSVFDYGCGRGDDLRILRGLGIEARGWDPHFAADDERREADVVNLGFVINVIEDVSERAEALLRAFKLAKCVLSVSALIGGRTAYERNRLFSDGVLTSRNTFQRYFQQQELREYVESVLGREPVAIGPGLFFVFPDDDGEQNFLAARQLRARGTAPLPCLPTVQLRARQGSPERVPSPRRLSKWDANRTALDDYWSRCLQLGRPPRPEELPSLGELRRNVGSPKSILARLTKQYGPEPLQQARRERMNDVLVYLALNAFERRRSRERIAPTLRPDIAAFWGGIAAAQNEGRRLLFSIADAEGILTACRDAASAGIGYLDGEHSLTVRPADTARLPPLLRVYTQSGVRLYGDLSEVDLVKIHTRSGKLTLLRYDRFEERAFPPLRERIKINLRRQVIDFFAGSSPDSQLCFPKSRFLSSSDRNREGLRALEQRLLDLGLAEDAYGCLASALQAVLDRHGMTLDDESLTLVPAGTVGRFGPAGSAQ